MNQWKLKEPLSFREESQMSTALCKLCDIRDWETPEFSELAKSIFGDPNIDPPKHRKLWEFTKTVEALQRFGLLDGKARGLSVAAGTERILFYLANYVERIVATDIYGKSTFAANEADPTFLVTPERYAPYEYSKERLFVRSMNALSLGFAENTFDFAFCMSSIEHFGGVRNAARALQEMGRVVRPGGLIIATTDCSLNGQTTDQIFSSQNIAKLVRLSGLQLVEPIDYSMSQQSVQHQLDFLKDDLSVTPHINLRYLGSVFTSICLVFQKKEASFDSMPLESFDEMVRSSTGGEFFTHPLLEAERMATWTYGRSKVVLHKLKKLVRGSC